MTGKTKTILSSSLAFLLLLIYLLLPPKNPLSPLTSNPFFQKPPNKYKILGFLPYWNLDKLSPHASNTITDIAYFSFTLKKEGLSPQNTQERKAFLNLTSQTLPKPLHLTISQTDKEIISSHLSTQTSRQTLIQSITTLITQHSLQGIIIDFEPTGGISPTLQDNFTLFIQQLRTSLNNLKPAPSLQIAIFPTAAKTSRLWQLKELSPYADYFIIMTYDYHRASDPKSGPNAPLRGSTLNFQEDILTNISETSQIIPSKQILLGVPFYGYEWKTTDSQKYAPTSQGYTASLERIDKLIQEKGLTPIWDRNSLTPYLIHQEEGETKQIYFDNQKSISLKLDLVKQAKLGGIAIWALGYEGNNPTLWQTISTLNSN